MKYKYYRNWSRNKGVIKIENQEISRREHFCCINSIIHKEGDIEKDVAHKIKAG